MKRIVAALAVLIMTGAPRWPVGFAKAAEGPNQVPMEILRKAAHVRPTPQQVAWQELETIAFIHFGMNTFTGRQWGDGKEDPRQFNPTALDAMQWAQVCKQAGLRMIILTAKHHDGFCLWPSKYTEHSVKRSPWRSGQGDVVRELADACRKTGLKFGVYLSPWDRHEPTYGSDQYNAFFKNQLRELLTGYGPVTEVWFDGACGEGPNGKRQVYDWEGYTGLVRQLQPEAVIFNMGPDIRWVGNERGLARESEWSVLPEKMMQEHRLKDLGDRTYLLETGKLVWFPAECDVSIRPGWFYDSAQDDKVKTLQQLLDIYYESVGRNSVLLLNLPPDRRGLIHENDVARLLEFRQVLDETFRENLAAGRPVTASNTRRGYAAQAISDGDKTTYWIAEEGVTHASLEVDLGRPVTFDRAMIQEEITQGQRVERFRLEARSDGRWRPIIEATTIGYKRLLRFPAFTGDSVRLTILESRDSPALRKLGLFRASPEENGVSEN